MRIVVQYQSIKPPLHFERQPGFPLWTVGLSLTGRMHITQGSRSIVAEPGFVSVLRPNTPYRVAITEGRRQAEYYAFLTMSADWNMWAGWPEMLPGRMSVKVRGTPVWEQTVAAFATAREHSAAGEAGEDLAHNAIERALLLANTVNKTYSRPVVDERIDGAISFARERLQEKLDVATLARAAHLSPSRLAHLFTEHLGESPMRHIEGLRVRRARELLLSTRMRIREIARLAGYDNPYHFSDRFRSRTGQSPRAFRQKPI